MPAAPVLAVAQAAPVAVDWLAWELGWTTTTTCVAGQWANCLRQRGRARGWDGLGWDGVGWEEIVGWGRGTIWALTPLRGMASMHQYRFRTDKYSVYASCTMRGMDTCTARCFPHVIGVRVHVMPSIQVLMLPTGTA